MASTENNKYDYFAFISYKREDEKWAKWLQKRLESYHIPTSLRKKDHVLPKRIRPVFRDQSELSGGNLKSEIEKGLDASKFLIVICSPRSAKSPWVSKEVQHFIDHERVDYIIPFIVGGTPNAKNPEEECFPEGLRCLNEEKEILGISINETGSDAAVIKVIARMLNLKFDMLWQRFEKERKRRFLMAIGAAVILFLMFIAMFFLYFDRKRAYADLAYNKELVEESKLQIEASYRQLSLAQDSVVLGNRRLRQAYDSLDITNSALHRSNIRLAEEKQKLKSANDKVTVQYAISLANHARLLASENRFTEAVAELMEAYDLTTPVGDIPEIIKRTAIEFYLHYEYPPAQRYESLANVENITTIPVESQIPFFDSGKNLLHLRSENSVYSYNSDNQHISSKQTFDGILRDNMLGINYENGNPFIYHNRDKSIYDGETFLTKLPTSIVEKAFSQHHLKQNLLPFSDGSLIFIIDNYESDGTTDIKYWDKNGVEKDLLTFQSEIEVFRSGDKLCVFSSDAIDIVKPTEKLEIETHIPLPETISVPRIREAKFDTNSNYLVAIYDNQNIISANFNTKSAEIIPFNKELVDVAISFDGELYYINSRDNHEAAIYKTDYHSGLELWAKLSEVDEFKGNYLSSGYFDSNNRLTIYTNNSKSSSFIYSYNFQDKQLYKPGFRSKSGWQIVYDDKLRKFNLSNPTTQTVSALHPEFKRFFNENRSGKAFFFESRVPDTPNSSKHRNYVNYYNVDGNYSVKLVDISGNGDSFYRISRTFDISDDGLCYVYTSRDNDVWSICYGRETNGNLFSTKIDSEPHHIALLPDGKRIVINSDHRISIYQISGAGISFVKSLQLPYEYSSSIRLYPNRANLNEIYLFSNDIGLSSLNLDNGMIKRIVDPTDPPTDYRFAYFDMASDGSMFLTIYNHEFNIDFKPIYLKIYDAQSNKVLMEFVSHDWNWKFSTDGKHLVSSFPGNSNGESMFHYILDFPRFDTSIKYLRNKMPALKN